MLQSPEKRRKDEQRQFEFNEKLVEIQEGYEQRLAKIEQLDSASNAVLNIGNKKYRDAELDPIPVDQLFPADTTGLTNFSNPITLQKIADLTSKIYPTTTLVGKNERAGYSFEESLANAHRDFVHYRQLIETTFVRQSFEVITDFDDMDAKSFKVNNIVGVIENMFKAIDDVIFLVDKQMLILYNALGEKELNNLSLLELFSPDIVPSLTGDWDVNKLKLKQIAEKSIFDYRTKPFLKKRYENAGYSESDAIKHTARDEEVMRQRLSQLIPTHVNEKLDFNIIQQRLNELYLKTLSLVVKLRTTQAVVKKGQGLLTGATIPEISDVIQRLEDIQDELTLEELLTGGGGDVRNAIWRDGIIPVPLTNVYPFGRNFQIWIDPIINDALSLLGTLKIQYLASARQTLEKEIRGESIDLVMVKTEESPSNYVGTPFELKTGTAFFIDAVTPGGNNTFTYAGDGSVRTFPGNVKITVPCIYFANRSNFNITNSEVLNTIYIGQQFTSYHTNKESFGRNYFRSQKILLFALNNRGSSKLNAVKAVFRNLNVLSKQNRVDIVRVFNSEVN